MSQSEQANRVHPGAARGPTAKKPYHKPQVRYEKVFETSAISCGKVQSHQSSCAHNRKNS
jgi:hypothetical protein